MGICHQISKETRSQKEKKMSDWVVLDISAITKTTNREKVLKILKAGGMTVCKVTDPYMSDKKNKNVITITVKRADYESKNPEYPGSWRRTMLPWPRCATPSKKKRLPRQHV